MIKDVNESKPDFLSTLSTARSNFIRASSIVSVVSILLAIWARAPSLSISGPIEGFTASFNVGYALFFGPLLIFLGTLWLGGSAKHLYELREVARTAWKSKPPRRLEVQIALAHFGNDLTPARNCFDRAFPYGAIAVQAFWHFVVPPLAFLFIYVGSFNILPYNCAMNLGDERANQTTNQQTLWCPTKRFADQKGTVKDDDRNVCHEDPKFDKLGFVVWRWSSEAVCIPNGRIKRGVQNELPYHDPLLNVWLYGFFLLVTVAYSIRASLFFFAHRYKRITVVNLKGEEMPAIRFSRFKQERSGD